MYSNQEMTWIRGDVFSPNALWESKSLVEKLVIMLAEKFAFIQAAERTTDI